MKNKPHSLTSRYDAESAKVPNVEMKMTHSSDYDKKNPNSRPPLHRLIVHINE